MKNLSLLELLNFIDKDLADFCKKNCIEDEEEIEEVWKMFRKPKIKN